MRVSLMVFFLLWMAGVQSSQAQAYELLEKSELLRASGVRLFIGEQQRDAIVFFDEDLDRLNLARDGKNVSLVSEQGIMPLHQKTASMPIEDACGNGNGATGFLRADSRDVFIVSGANAKAALKWLPAKPVPLPKTSCFDDVLSLGKMTHQYAHNLPASKGIISTMLVKHNYSKEEKLFRCVTKPAVRHDSGETYIVPAQECMKAPYDNYGYLRRTVYSEGNMCRIVLTSELNDEAMPIEKGDSIQNFLGVLEITYKNQKETWLFWDAPGYEGDGIYGIKIEDLKTFEKPSAEWLVYTGC